MSAEGANPSPCAPAWLDEKFIEEALRNAGQAEKVVALSVRPMGSVGDAYCSSMYRVQAHLGSGDELALIVKCPPGSEKAAQAILGSGFFVIEGKVMGELGPAMEGLLEAATEAASPPIGARCLHHGDSPDPFLVLEDLAPAGFRLADRFRGLGLRHSLLVIRTLARFHAASVALLEQHPGAFQGMPHPLKGGGHDSFEAMIQGGLRQFASHVRGWRDLPDSARYADKIERLSQVGYDKVVEANEPLPGQLNVLLHGDCWTNNCLFRYGEDGRVQDVRFVDFQMSRYASPAIDLLYFLHTSLSEEVYIRHVDLLRREYLHELNRHLRALGLVDRHMSWEQLKVAEDACSAHVTFAAFFCLPNIKTPPERAFDMGAAIQDGEGVCAGGEGPDNQHLYDNPLYRPWALRLLPEFDKKGWLDV